MQIAKSRLRVTSTGAELDTQAMSLESNGKGEYTCLMPIRLPNSGAAGDTRVFAVQVPLTVTSEGSRNAKGRTRVMLKVSMPYQAISPDVANTGVVASQLDNGRTGGEITAHIVISVPKTAADDLKGVNGSTLQRSANAQVFAVLRTLMCSFDRLNKGYTYDSAGASDAFREAVPYVYDAVPGRADFSDYNSVPAGVEPYFGAEPLSSAIDNDPYSRPRLKIGTVTGYSRPGYDLTDAYAGIADDPSNPLTRALNGLSPLAPEAVLVAENSLRINETKE